MQYISYVKPIQEGKKAKPGYTDYYVSLLLKDKSVSTVRKLSLAGKLREAVHPDPYHLFSFAQVLNFKGSRRRKQRVFWKLETRSLTFPRGRYIMVRTNLSKVPIC